MAENTRMSTERILGSHPGQAPERLNALEAARPIGSAHFGRPGGISRRCTPVFAELAGRRRHTDVRCR